MSRHMSPTNSPWSCSLLETPKCVQISFLLLYPCCIMSIYCLWLLLVLSAYTEHPKPFDTHDPSICPLDLNSSFAQLGVLAPVASE